MNKFTRSLPLVSFVIPTWNSTPYLDDLFTSFEGLDFAHEVVFVDDASDDGTISKVRELADSSGLSYRLVASEVNRGQSYCRNLGLTVAVGTYVQFIDSDDFLEPTLENEAIKKVQKQDLDILFFEATAFADQESDREKAKAMTSYYQRNYRSYPDQQNGCDLFVSMVENYDWKPSPCLYVFRRSLISTNEKLFREGELMEDNAATIKLGIAAKSASIARLPVYRRRIRSGSSSQAPENELRRIRGHLMASQDILGILQDSKDGGDVRQALLTQATLLIQIALRLMSTEKSADIGGSRAHKYSPFFSRVNYLLRRIRRTLLRS